MVKFEILQDSEAIFFSDHLISCIPLIIIREATFVVLHKDDNE